MLEARTHRRAWAAWALVGAAFLSTAWGQTVVRDDTRRPTLFSAPPQRIVSLLPAITEMVCELGACDRLVGVDRHSNHPTTVRGLPRLGGLEDTPLETVLKLQPDLVLVAGSARLLPRLQSLGLRVMVFEPRDLPDTERMARSLSMALTGSLSAWTAYEQRQQSSWLALAARTPPRWRQASVYIEVGEGPYVAAETSFMGEGLRRVGLRSAVPGDWGPFPRLSPEWVWRAGPDWIVLGSTATPVPRRPGWGQLAAVQGQRVCVLSADQMDTLVRPGPRLHEGIGAILDCLQARTQ